MSKADWTISRVSSKSFLRLFSRKPLIITIPQHWAITLWPHSPDRYLTKHLQELVEELLKQELLRRQERGLRY